MCPDSRFPGRKQTCDKPYYLQFRHMSPLPGTGQKPPNIHVPRCQPWPTLQAGLSKDSSPGPAMLTFLQSSTTPTSVTSVHTTHSVLPPRHPASLACVTVGRNQQPTPLCPGHYQGTLAGTPEESRDADTQEENGLHEHRARQILLPKSERGGRSTQQEWPHEQRSAVGTATLGVRPLICDGLDPERGWR